MPASRNIPPNRPRHSGRLEKCIPVIYDKDGWPTPQSINPVALHKIKAEPLDDVPLPPITTLSSVSPVISPSNRSDLAHHSCLQEQTPPCSLSGTQDTIDELAEPELPPVVSRRNSHTRRRDPGHIPRPRNAFIMYRSYFISSGSASGEGQQNEISKTAGKHWNKLTDEEKAPYQERAAIEKMEHRIKYPDYVYAPGKVGMKGKSKVTRRINSSSGSSLSKKKRASISHRDEWSRSSATSSEEPVSSPEPAYVAPPPRLARVIRAAAQRAVQRIIRSPSPTPSPHLVPVAEERVKSEENSPTPSLSPLVEDDFVPTSEIPVLELSPTEEPKKELEPEPKFDPAPFHPHLDRVPEQFGFKHYLTPAAMYASLPILPRAGTPTDVEDSYTFPAPIPVVPIQPIHLQSPPPARVTLPHPSEFTYAFPSEPAQLAAESSVDAFPVTVSTYSYGTDQNAIADEASSSVVMDYFKEEYLEDVPEDDLVAMEEFFDFENFGHSAMAS